MNYFPQDNNGYILNPTHKDKITPIWQPVLAEIIHWYQQKEGISNLHSIWLRGSLARGNYYPNLSDVDTFALVKSSHFRWKEADWAATAGEELLQKYPFVPKIEWMLSSYSNDFITQKPKMAMLIKTQSLCLWGIDLREQIAPFKPGKDMMLNYRWVAEDVQDFLGKEKIQKFDIQEIIKILIRTSFELVMEREGKFTTDLPLCIESFLKYYPEQKSIAHKMLNYYVTPKKEAKLDIERWGKWLIKEIGDLR